MTTLKLTKSQLEVLSLIEARGAEAHIAVGEETENLLALMAAGLVRTPKTCWHVILTDAGRAALRGES